MSKHPSCLWAAFVLFAGCGGGSARPAHGPLEPGWPVWPATETVACGAPLTECAHAASIRIHWPGDAHAPADAHASIDGEAIDVRELALGTCATPGMRQLEIAGTLEGSATRSASITVEVLAGATTDVVLRPAAVPVSFDADVTFATRDVSATIAALGEVELPRLGPDATPEERRVFGPQLAAAFDAWRAQLARVAEFAEQQGDLVLRAAATDHRSRAEGIASTLQQERPSADRLASIQRAMQDEIAAAGSMIAIEHVCPVWTHESPAPSPLVPVSVEARPYTTVHTFVARARMAIDDVEVLDTGSPGGDELMETATSEGVAPPGEHLIRVEATFVERESGARHRVLREARMRIPETGVRLRMRALGSETLVAQEEDLLIEIGARR